MIENSMIRGIELGVQTNDSRIVPIIRLEGSPGGVRVQRDESEDTATVFTTVADGQRKALFNIHYRTARDRAWRFLDSLPLSGIPMAQAGVPDLEVRAALHGSGAVTVSMADGRGRSLREFTLPREVVQRLLRRADQELPEPPVPSATRNEEPVTHGSRRTVLVWILGGAGAAAVLCAALLVAPRYWQDRRPRAESAAPQTAAAVDESVPAAAVDESAPAAAAGSSAEAPEPATASAQHSGIHRVEWGDTLWRIAERYYGDRDLYPQLAARNRLPDPDRIIAGEEIILPRSVEGRSVIRSAGEEGR